MKFTDRNNEIKKLKCERFRLSNHHHSFRTDCSRNVKYKPRAEVMDNTRIEEHIKNYSPNYVFGNHLKYSQHSFKKPNNMHLLH